MRRREFLGVLGGSVANWPTVALGQPTQRLRRIAVFFGSAESDPGLRVRKEALRDGLQKLGCIEGQNIHIEYIEYRWANWTIQ
jgi:putative ABC transport system substrate-binding protein